MTSFANSTTDHLCFSAMGLVTAVSSSVASYYWTWTKHAQVWKGRAELIFFVYVQISLIAALIDW